MNGRQRRMTMNPSGPNSRGFTLMEMMISVVIIGVIATMAGPRLTKEITKIEFRGAARDLVSTLREARSLSITEKQQYAISFDYTKGSYSLFKKGPTQDILVRTKQLPGDSPTVTQSFTGPLVFSADGSANNSGQISIFSYDDDGATHSTSFATIDILASTGRIKLSELYTY